MAIVSPPPAPGRPSAPDHRAPAAFPRELPDPAGERPAARGVRRALPWAVAAASVVVALALGEAGLRLLGYAPWRAGVPAGGPGLKVAMHDPDPVLGWWPKPGRWHREPFAPGGPPFDITIEPSRARRTADAPPAGAHPEVLLLGCSFTFGWAVSDADTWAWRLQALRPDLAVVNHGVTGYGTMQSLLLLERLLASGERPAHVVYGYIAEQSIRNVADPVWLGALAWMWQHGVPAVPYATLAPDGGLVRHPPIRWPSWPLEEESAAVTLAERAWLTRTGSARAAEADAVTQRLVVAMADRLKADGIPFSLLLLKVGEPEHGVLADVARAHGIDVVDCDRPLPPADWVPGETHPNPRVHAEWGACVARALPAR